MSKEGYEQEFVNEAFKTNWIAPLGPNVDNFEKRTRYFSRYKPCSSACFWYFCNTPCTKGRRVLKMVTSYYVSH